MRFTFSVLLCCIIASSSPAQEIFSPNDAGETPNQSYDVLHYKIEVTLHDKSKSLDGRVTTTLVPLFPSLKTVAFDAGEMKIKSVTNPKGIELRFTSSPESLSVILDRPYSYKDTLSICIEYSCTPKKGLTFNNTDG
jgi:hypothetical protein